MLKALWRSAWRLLVLLLICGVSLQLFFLARIALMIVVDPQSTTFQRSQAWRLVRAGRLAWRQDWLAYERLSPHLKRAVIASEDAGFAEHGGVDWDALEKAWERNQKAELRAEKLNERLARRQATARQVQPKVVGGSTITQQLAKNLFLSTERQLPRKAQEFVIAYMLEALLGKQRILEIYLNSVEWGEGVFGAQAAARHYYRIDAGQLSPAQAARLAVILPAPKRFEKRFGSGYVASRAATVAARMDDVTPP